MCFVCVVLYNVFGCGMWGCIGICCMWVYVVAWLCVDIVLDCDVVYVCVLYGVV